MAKKQRPASPVPRQHFALAWAVLVLGLVSVVLVWATAAAIKPVDQAALAGHLSTTQETVATVTEGGFSSEGQVTTDSGTSTPYSCLPSAPQPGQKVDVTRLDAVTTPGAITLVQGEVVFIGDCDPADLVAKSGGSIIKHYQPQAWSWARGLSVALLFAGLISVTVLQHRRQKASADQARAESTHAERTS